MSESIVSEREVVLISEAGELPEGVIAVINDLPIPYEWFLHTFRSSFFQYGNDPNVRQRVYDDFLGRMLLYRAALEAGVREDPDVDARILDQVSKSRAFMEFQLEMMEVGIVSEAYLARRGVKVDAVEISDDDIATFLERLAITNPNVPTSVDDVPDDARRHLVQRLRLEKHKAYVEGLIQQLWGEMAVDMNLPLVETVPFPDIIDP